MKLVIGTRKGLVQVEPDIVVAGLDFGYTTDPTVLEIGARISPVWFNFREVYRERISNVELLQLCVRETRAWGISRIWADARDPRTIEYLQSHNVPVIANNVREVDYGIRVVYGLMKQWANHPVIGEGPRFRVDREKCPNLVTETQKYGVRVTRGELGGKPIDKHNHSLDCVRYYITGEGEIPVESSTLSPVERPAMYLRDGKWVDDPVATMARKAAASDGDVGGLWWDEQAADDVEIIGFGEEI